MPIQRRIKIFSVGFNLNRNAAMQHRAVQYQLLQQKYAQLAKNQTSIAQSFRGEKRKLHMQLAKLYTKIANVYAGVTNAVLEGGAPNSGGGYLTNAEKFVQQAIELKNTIDLRI